jgi:dUTP pyrophosphatase
MEMLPFILVATCCGLLGGLVIRLFNIMTASDFKEPLVIPVKYFADIAPIEKFGNGDWIDLRAAEDVSLKAGQYTAIPLGVAMELPFGYEALVVPRSSTFKRYGIIAVNSVGIIDESYCGENDEWHMLVYAMRDTEIKKNERICQFRVIEHQPEVLFQKVAFLGNDDRGGIGSSGRF